MLHKSIHYTVNQEVAQCVKIPLTKNIQRTVKSSISLCYTLFLTAAGARPLPGRAKKSHLIQVTTMFVWLSSLIKTGLKHFPHKGTIVFALFFISLVLFGCSPQNNDHIRFALQSMPVTLDPRFSTDAASSRINRLLFQRLIGFDDNFQVIPELAQWQQINPKTYRFELIEPDRQFHHGRQLDANDVAATYQYIKNPANASPHRSSLDVIARMDVVDGTTIDFYLNEADTLFPSRLGIAILPAELIASGHNFRKQPIGSGEFQFIAQPSPTRLQLQRLFDKQGFDFVHMPNPTTRVLKLINNEIDMMQNDISPELVAYLERHAGIYVKRSRGSNFTYLGLNLESQKLNKSIVRQALAHALNKQEIITFLFQGSARPANTILSDDHWAGNAQLDAYSYDPELARKFLAEAGYDENAPLELTYKTSSDPFRIRLATVIQSQLEAVGVVVDIQSYDWGTFYGDIKSGRFQLYSLSWVGIKSPDIFRYVFHSSAFPPEGANRGRYVNHQVDNLIEAAALETDVDAQADFYQQMQSIIHDDLPYIPLWYEDHVYLSRDTVSGYSMSVDGSYDGLKTVIKQ